MAAILLGVEGITLTDFFESAGNALPGDAASFAVSWFGKVSQSVSSASRRLFSQRYGNNPGWDLYTSGTNGSANFGCGGGSGTAASPTSTITASDAGKLLLFTGVWDSVAGKARLYAKRAEIASGSTLTGGYLPDTSVKAQIGRRDGPLPFPADGVATYGVFYATGLPTLAQIQSQFEAVMATERIAAIPGMTGGLTLDLTQLIIDNGGTLPATLIDRGPLGASFSRVGSPTLSAHYTRSWVW